MPAYNKKITRLMDYKEFRKAVIGLDSQYNKEAKQALLSVLFFAGCRVSEALALTSNEITCTADTIYIQFFRLKGSKQTDPQELPRADALVWLCEQEGKLFPFKRITAYRTVKKVFPELYPHYFRMNRFTNAIERFSATTVCQVWGVSINTVAHYMGKVEIKRVGKALREELV